jgi:transposase
VNLSNYRGYKPEAGIFLVSQPVDFRKSINGLTALIQEDLNRSPMENACFVFCNSQRNKIKIIEWDFNGFWLSYKRLESGKFQWPSSEEPLLEVSRDQYDWLMNGLAINQRDGFKEVLARKVI